MSRIAVVTGANRGIGREIARQLGQRGDTVLLTARDGAKAERTAKELTRAGAPVEPHQLDVTDPASIERFAKHLERNYGRLDVLVNNAAIHYDTWQQASSADLEVVREAWETNLFGAWALTLAVLPGLRASDHGRIVNVSSEAGSLSEMSSGSPAYRTSKAALNALTCMLAAELRSRRILVNSVCPGWIATDMGGAGGQSVSVGAERILWAIDIPDNGPTGGFFRDGKRIPW